MSQQKKVVVGAKVLPQIVRRLDAEAARQGVSRSDILRWAVLRYLQEAASERPQPHAR